MAMTENDIPAAPPLEGDSPAPAPAPYRATPGAGPDGEAQRDAVGPGDAADGRAQALRAVQVALVKQIDASIARIEQTSVGEGTREHLEILRSLLKAQVTTYLEHFVVRRAMLFSQTSVMYAGEMDAPGVVSTTFRGLLDGGTLTAGQGAKLAQFLRDRRTLVIFGDRGTGKSTLLNSLFELIPVDERCVAVERGPDLPALKERSFCVRLGVDTGTDIPGLFAKARRMDPSRLVIGEMHAQEVRGFFGFLAEDPRAGGLATLRAETVHEALDGMVAAFGGDEAYARELLARVEPVLVHMRPDEKGRPRLAAIWSVRGLAHGELLVREVPTAAPAATELVAEA
jgi:energy-coupling factor transporter ATP-binding protein EcfA2